MSDLQNNGGAALVLDFPSLKYAPKRYVTTKRQLTDPVAFFENNVEPQWGEKRQQVLTTWLNKVLTPPIEMVETDDGVNRPIFLDPNELLVAMKKTLSSDVAPKPMVPTKEEASIQMYVSRYWFNRLRVQASILYMSLEPLLSQLDDAVDNQKIAIRKDRNIYNNVGLQRYVLGVLHSVYPLWLRIGLETVYGMEIGQIKGNNDRYGMSVFILQNLFNDPGLQKQHGFSSVVNYYKEEYGREIGKFFIKKFLRLFIFLDYAKRNRLIKHDPCLFHRDANDKSIRDVFTALTTEALSGDGNLFKLLKKAGYDFGYCQTYVDEFHYVVKNILHDLRDGVILCRVLELLTGDYTLMPKLRCPPISILQKVYNVGVALQVLAQHNMQTNDLSAKKIVEGHVEQTMKLVKRMMDKFTNIKIGDGVTQLAGLFVLFQARCKGYLVRKTIAKLKEEEASEDKTVTCGDQRGTESDSPDTAGGNGQVINIKTSDSVAESADVLTFFQARCKGYLLRQKLLKAKEAEASEDKANHCVDQGVSESDSLQAAGIDNEQQTNIKTGDCAAQSAGLVTLFQAHCKGYLLRQNLLKVKKEGSGKEETQTCEQQEKTESDAQQTPVVDHVQITNIKTSDSVAQSPDVITLLQARCKGYLLRQILLKAKNIKIGDGVSQLGAFVLFQARCKLFIVRQAIAKVKEEARNDNANGCDDQGETETDALHTAEMGHDPPTNIKTSDNVTQSADVFTLFQARCKGYLLRQNLLKAKDSKNGDGMPQLGVFVLFQARCKGFVERQTFAKVKEEKAIQDEETKRNRAASIIQVWWKRIVVLRHFWNVEIVQGKAKRRAAMIIQAAWRGYRFRCNPNNFPAIVEKVRQRIAAATEAATEQQTVGVRTLTGLDYLLNYESLTMIQKGLEELVVVTRLSGTSCVRLVENGAIRVLFELIHQMNLSVASQVIIWLAVSVLFNLAKYDKTRPSIAQVYQWPAKLINLLQKFQDAGRDNTFVKVALLLIMMSQDEEATAEIASCKMGLQKLRGMQAVFVRRAERRRDQERQKLVQERGKAAVVLDERRNKTKRVNFWEGKVIRFTPDWILANDKPNEVMSKEDAMAWLAHVLLGNV